MGTMGTNNFIFRFSMNHHFPPLLDIWHISYGVVGSVFRGLQQVSAVFSELFLNKQSICMQQWFILCIRLSV